MPYRAPRQRAPVIMGLVVVLLLLIAGVVVLNAAATLRTDRVRAGWESTLGTPADVFARNPTTAANETALELERIAARLGIALAPHHADSRPAPADADRERHASLKRTIGDYGRRELERVGTPVAPPPPDLAAFLGERERLLDEVRRLLLAGEPPRWESDVGKLDAAPIPNLLGNIDLARLLTVDALADIAAGHPEAADESLRAVWQLARSLRETPILINQLVAVAETRFAVGALRHVAPLDAEWAERLVEHDHLASMIGALRHDGWVLGQYATRRPEPSDDMLERLADLVLAPYARYRLAGASDALRRELEWLDELGPLCDGAAIPFDEPDPESAGFWGRVTGWVPDQETYMPNAASTLHRVARLELELELTRKLVELDRARRRLGAWPAASAGIERSDACPDDRWSYEVDGSGRMRLAFSRGELPWPGLKGTRLPNRVVR